MNPLKTSLYRAVTLKQGNIKEDLTVGKNKIGYVNGRKYQVIVQQEGRHVLHASGKTAKSAAEVLPSKICFVENDAFAESRRV